MSDANMTRRVVPSMLASQGFTRPSIDEVSCLELLVSRSRLLVSRVVMKHDGEIVQEIRGVLSSTSSNDEIVHGVEEVTSSFDATRRPERR